MHDTRGFSLLEVLIATTILTVSFAALAELCAMATRTNRSARTTTYAVILAQQKMEQLRSLTWGFDAIGLPLTDTTTDTTVVPERDAGGTGLSLSPADALGRNTDGYVDYLDCSATRSVAARRRSTEPSTSGAGQSSRCPPVRTTPS